jgi:hypothetical protein
MPDKRDLEDALSVFCRDGYGSIVIYLKKKTVRKAKGE